MNKQEAIVAAMPKVEQIANSVYQEVRNSGVDWEDLVAEGNLALCEAAETWDPDQGGLEPYASQRIRGAMLDHAAGDTRNITLSIRANRLVYKVRNAENELCQQLGREPTTQEIADHLRVEERSVLEAIENDKMFIPLGQDATEKRPSVDHQHTNNLENLPAPDYTQDEPVGLLTEKVINLVDTLPDRAETDHDRERLDQEREIVASRYGLFGHRPQTVEQIALRLNLTERESSKNRTVGVHKATPPVNTNIGSDTDCAKRTFR